jgi:hypothetical protein
VAVTESRRKGKSVVERAVTPLVAALTTAAVRYLVKKAPRFLEQTVMPKLREGGKGAGDIGETLTRRARAASGQARTGPTRSADELERRRRARARHRAARRNATS